MAILKGRATGGAASEASGRLGKAPYQGLRQTPPTFWPLRL